MPKPQQTHFGRFKARGQYQFGVLKRDSDPTSPSPEFTGKNRTFPGSYFLSLGCRTFSEFVAKNPLGLPDTLHTCYQVNMDGSRSYFGEGTPLPRQMRPAGPVTPTLSDAPAMPGGPVATPFRADPAPLLPPPIRTGLDSHEHIEFLRDHIRRLEHRIAEKDSTINALYQQLADLREQSATLRKSLEGVQAVQGLRDQSHKNEMHVLTQLQQQKKGGGLEGFISALPSLLSIAERMMTKGEGGDTTPPPIPQPQPPAAPTQPRPAGFFPRRPIPQPTNGRPGMYSDFDDVEEQP